MKNEELLPAVLAVFLIHFLYRYIDSATCNNTNLYTSEKTTTIVCIVPRILQKCSIISVD